MSEEATNHYTSAKQAKELHSIDSRKYAHAEKSIRNFDLVTPWFFRGGQPGKEGIQALADLGVKTVVCLRWSRKLIEAERTAVESVGMKFVSIPLNYWNTPTPRIIDEFFDLIHEAENRPVFLHCMHGADRTGLMVAMYRITHQEWHFDRAYEDMKAHGFHRFRIRNFKWVLWRYAARHPGQAHLWWFIRGL
jgi:protein tyrosine/serine phosphatase